ncbi:hypothetical protein ATANTOWER_000346 [Ataeniobius toweri]|uniref:Uncharacterized protein n=1 Tax=Ataeniobius toweri TaxID=208326 RepID=A0ABU7C7W4_9TELE|nr:hypothetical protein [Ataeniobius toweri]
MLSSVCFNLTDPINVQPTFPPSGVPLGASPPTSMPSSTCMASLRFPSSCGARTILAFLEEGKTVNHL